MKPLQQISESQSDRLKEFLETMLQKLTSRKHVKHAIIGVESGDRSFHWIGVAGDASADGTLMHSTTPFMIASVTKLFIAASTLKLYEQNKLSLDKPIFEYLPESMVGKLHVLDGTDYSSQITVRHLLSHTTGLPDWLEDKPKGGKALLDQIEGLDDRLISITEAVEYVKENLTPHFPPRSFDRKKIKIRYSDTNFQLLMAILEQVMSRPIHQVFDLLIYRPLNLNNTFHPGHQPSHLTIKSADTWIYDNPFTQPLWFQSFRDLYSTADDLLYFIRAIFQHEFFQHRETLELIQTWNKFGFPRDFAGLRQPNWPIEYGLGMMRFKMPRLFTPFKPVPALLGHTGVSGSWLFYCPDFDLYLSGTVNQITEAPLPFRFLPKVLQKIDAILD